MRRKTFKIAGFIIQSLILALVIISLPNDLRVLRSFTSETTGVFKVILYTIISIEVIQLIFGPIVLYQLIKSPKQGQKLFLFSLSIVLIPLFIVFLLAMYLHQ